MNGITELVKRVSERMSEGVVYPADLLARFNPSLPLDRVIKSYLVEGKEAGGYFHWLTLLAQEAAVPLIVELGNRHGTSTIALYHGLRPETRLYTIDVTRDLRYVPDKVFKDPRVSCLFGDCLDLTIFQASALEMPLDIDILWTDTVHVYRQLRAEYEVYEPLLADEALILVDDIHLNDKGRFFDEWAWPKWDLTPLCHQSGFAAFHYIRPEAERRRSPEKRRLEALRRSAHQGYENFWDLFRRHEALSQALENDPLRRAIGKTKRIINRLTGVR